jgi:CubicO group peptidase (beta-lactamase class C family)
VQQLLNMRSGLEFVEDYVDDGVSHVIDMLFGSGKDDVAGYASRFALVAGPGTLWNYSSGTSNILSRIVGEVVGGGEWGMRAFMQRRLFGPLGMSSADPRFDAAGTFIGSSFLYATARDFAKFGLLYLHDGMCSGQRLLPPGWADHASTPTPVPTEEPYGYGAHWWLWPREPGSFAAHGFEGQRLVVLPRRDLVVVRLGRTLEHQRPGLDAALRAIFSWFPQSSANPGQIG